MQQCIVNFYMIYISLIPGGPTGQPLPGIPGITANAFSHRCG
jgi:hypothetical protein